MTREAWSYDPATQRVLDENGLKVAEGVLPEDAPLVTAAPLLLARLKTLTEALIADLPQTAGFKTVIEAQAAIAEAEGVIDAD